jgi:hypothetical protein
MTGIPSLWEVLDMGLGGAAEIDDAPAQERYEISRAAGGFDLLAEDDVAVVGGIGLRPWHQALDLAGIEGRGDIASGRMHVHHYGVAIRQVVGLAVAAIVDRVALEAGSDQFSDNFRKAQASIVGSMQASFCNRNPFRVYGGFLSFQC